MSLSDREERVSETVRDGSSRRAAPRVTVLYGMYVLCMRHLVIRSGNTTQANYVRLTFISRRYTRNDAAYGKAGTLTTVNQPEESNSDDV